MQPELVRFFADDSKIYGPDTDHVLLQKDLNACMEWYNLWKM